MELAEIEGEGQLETISDSHHLLYPELLSHDSLVEILRQVCTLYKVVVAGRMSLEVGLGTTAVFFYPRRDTDLFYNHFDALNFFQGVK